MVFDLMITRTAFVTTLPRISMFAFTLTWPLTSISCWCSNNIDLASSLTKDCDCDYASLLEVLSIRLSVRRSHVIFRCAVASLWEVVCVCPSVRLSRAIFRRVLGASCAVYPALLNHRIHHQHSTTITMSADEVRCLLVGDSFDLALVVSPFSRRPLDRPNRPSG